MEKRRKQKGFQNFHRKFPKKMKIKLVTVDSYSCEGTAGKLKYFVEGEHIDYWRYSPESCERIIETVFDDSAEQ